MKKVAIPFTKIIIGFKAEFYEMLEDLSARKMGQESHYSVEWLWFSKKVAHAYDTHFYGIRETTEFIGEPWVKETSKETSKSKIKLPKIEIKLPSWSSWRDTMIQHFQKQTILGKMKIRLWKLEESFLNKHPPKHNYSKMPFWEGFFLFLRSEIISFWPRDFTRQQPSAKNDTPHPSGTAAASSGRPGQRGYTDLPGPGWKKYEIEIKK